MNSNNDFNDNNSSSSSSSSSSGFSSDSNNNDNTNNLKLGYNNDHIQISSSHSSSSSSSSSSSTSSSNSIFSNTTSINYLREEVVYINITAILPVIIEWMNVQPIENGILRQLSSSINKPTVLLTSPSSSTTTTSITFMSTYFPTFYLINNRIDGLNDVPISLHLPLHRLLSKIVLYGAYGDVDLSRVLDYFQSLKIGILCNFIGTC